MRLLLRAATVAPLLGAALGHGMVYEPPSRNSRGIRFMEPGCGGFGCFWYSEGASIGCPEITAGLIPGRTCKNPFTPGETQNNLGCCLLPPAEPALTPEKTPELLTYNIDGNNSGELCAFNVDGDCSQCTSKCTGGATDGLKRTCKCGDWSKTHPWRKPGNAPVGDPCGYSAGWSDPKHQFDPFLAPGSKPGDRGSQLPKLMQETVWIAGSEVEVGWSIIANHGGGYSYRLCPAGKVTEECFQKTPLNFVGTSSWIQFGNGMDVNNRTEFPAHQVSVGTTPPGSQWRRNPIPPCKGGTFGVGGGEESRCTEPMFPPAVPGLFGFGLTAEVDERQQGVVSLVGIVDKLHIPKVPAGQYVLGFRWDAEQTSQIWQSCADVTIKEAGEPSPAFAPLSGCDPCCGEGICANCTKCVNDKTGDCAYCWKPFPWLDMVSGSQGGNGSTGENLPMWMRTDDVKITCLGHENAQGGAPYDGKTYREYFGPGGAVIWTKGISPGCPKCWAQKDACTPSVRGRK